MCLVATRACIAGWLIFSARSHTQLVTCCVGLLVATMVQGLCHHSQQLALQQSQRRPHPAHLQAPCSPAGAARSHPQAWTRCFSAHTTLAVSLCACTDERMCLAPSRGRLAAEREGNAVLARQWLLLWCARAAGCFVFSLYTVIQQTPCTKQLYAVQGIEKEVALESAPDSLLRDDTDETCG